MAHKWAALEVGVTICLSVFRLNNTHVHFKTTSPQLFHALFVAGCTFFFNFLTDISLSGACFRTALMVPFQLNLPTMQRMMHTALCFVLSPKGQRKNVPQLRASWEMAWLSHEQDPKSFTSSVTGASRDQMHIGAMYSVRRDGSHKCHGRDSPLGERTNRQSWASTSTESLRYRRCSWAAQPVPAFPARPNSQLNARLRPKTTWKGGERQTGSVSGPATGQTLLFLV